MAHAAPIVLLTDFGTTDGYPGVMKGVMLGIAPDAAIVDLSHDVPAHDVFGAAWLLETAWRYFPAASIFVCVVDPGVGTARRGVGMAASGRYFIGPDNGLFSYLLAADVVTSAVSLDRSAYHLPAASNTFHGRDVFAPVAAHLAAGIPLVDLGMPVAVGSLVRLPLSQPEWQADVLVGHVRHVDRFGNVITDIGGELATAALTSPDAFCQVGRQHITQRVRAFGEADASVPAMLRDSSGQLAICIREGSAARVLGLERGDTITIHGIQVHR